MGDKQAEHHKRKEKSHRHAPWTERCVRWLLLQLLPLLVVVGIGAVVAVVKAFPHAAPFLVASIPNGQFLAMVNSEEGVARDSAEHKGEREKERINKTQHAHT